MESGSMRNSCLDRKMRLLVFAFAIATSGLSFLPGDVHAGNHLQRVAADDRLSFVDSLEGVSAWLRDRFSKAEIDALSPEDLGVESHLCSCADEPAPHFPYRIVLFTTPKGDLVARPEAHEQSAQVTLLAVRDGERYCQLDSEEECYGSFATVCEFTDFRYGPTLEPYFPTCKQ